MRGTPAGSKEARGTALARAPKAGGNRREWRSRGLLTALVVLLLTATRGYYLGDTGTYIIQITDAFRSKTAGLWEFGHLLWRPLGFAMVKIANPLLGRITGQGPEFLCALALVGVSLACGVGTVLLWHSLALRASRSRTVAFLAALGFACSSAFLTYSHSGSPYVPGLFLVTLSAWLLREPGARSAARVASAAVVAALATLFWFPYVLSAPGIVFLGLWPTGKGATAPGKRDAMLFAARFSAVFTLALGLGFGTGAWARGIRTAAEARAWIDDSSHGWMQTDRAMRMATGLPRSFFYMGKDGVLYRRFLRKDPYAPVAAADLARASLWKLGMFYVFAAALVYTLLRTHERWWAAALLAAGCLPVLLFAVAVFEPGSPERYLPGLPFLVIAAALALRDIHSRLGVAQWAVLAFLASMAVNNAYAMNRARIDRADAASIRRITDLAVRVKARSVVAILSNQDDLEDACNRAVFGSFERPRPFRVYDVVEIATARTATWREDFVREAGEAWAAGGDVWLSKRLRQEQPLPEWNWVEGDDRRVSWRDIHEFFQSLQTADESGGPDGFVRLTRAEANLERLAAASACPPGNCPPAEAGAR